MTDIILRSPGVADGPSRVAIPSRFKSPFVAGLICRQSRTSWTKCCSTLDQRCWWWWWWFFFLEETSNLISRRLVAETQNCKKRRDGTGCQFHGPMSTEPQAVKITAVREMSNLSQNRVTAVSSNLGTCGDRASWKPIAAIAAMAILYHIIIYYIHKIAQSRKDMDVMTWKDWWPFTTSLILHSTQSFHVQLYHVHPKVTVKQSWRILPFGSKNNSMAPHPTRTLSQWFQTAPAKRVVPIIFPLPWFLICQIRGGHHFHLVPGGLLHYLHLGNTEKLLRGWQHGQNEKNSVEILLEVSKWMFLSKK